MDKAATIVSMASLVLVSMNLSLSIVLARKSKESWAKWNIVLAATLLGMAVFYTLNLLSSFLFSGIPLVVLNYVFEAFYIIDTSFIVVFICRFASWLVAKPMGKIEIVSTFIVGLVYLAFSIVSTIINLPTIKMLQPLVAALNIIYCLVIMLYYRSKLQNALVKDVVNVFAIITLTTVPLLVISSIFPPSGKLVFSIIEMAYFIMYLCFMFIALEKAEKNGERAKREGGPTLEDYAEFKITEREFEVIKLIKKGLTNKEIAFELGISVNTVNNHIANIFQKTNVKSRIDLLNVLQEATW